MPYILCSILVAIGIEAFNRFNEEAKELNSLEGENDNYQDSADNEKTDQEGCWMHIKVLYMCDLVCSCFMYSAGLLKQCDCVYNLPIFEFFPWVLKFLVLVFQGASLGYDSKCYGPDH